MRRATRISGMKAGLWCAGVVGGLALAGALAAQTQAPTVHINAEDYGPIPSGLKVGDTVTWVNDDTVAHTVTARDRSFDLHLNPGQKVVLTLKKDGTFPIYCIYHSTMRGVLIAAAK